MPEIFTKGTLTKVVFGDVVRQVKDKVDPEESSLERYVAGEHMDTNDLKIRRWGIIGDNYLGPAFNMRFLPGHILYGSRRTYLRKVALADFEGITANTTYVLESKDPDVLLPELLPFIMQTESFHQHSVKQSKGSVNPYVNFSDLAWYEFALPPLEEQRRIAEVLQAALSMQEAARHLQGQLDELVERCRIDWVDRNNTSTARLSEVCVLRGGSGFKPSYQGQAEGELPFVKVSDMDLDGNEKYMRRAQNHISRQQASELKARVMPAGSIVLAKVGAALFKNRRRILLHDTCIDNNMMAAIPDSSEVLPEYLYLVLLGVDFKSLAQEGVVPSVNQTILGKLRIPILSLDKQKKLLARWREIEIVLRSSKERLVKVSGFTRHLIEESLSCV